MNEALREELAATAAGEAARLDELVALLEATLGRARAEAAQLGGMTEEQVAQLRRGLRQERFADVAGLEEELAAARGELGMVQELRRRLADG